MKKIIFSLFVLIVLGACSSTEYVTIDDIEYEIIPIEDVHVPSVIFTSNKTDSSIDEEEMKQSIQTYLDSHDDLNRAYFSFSEAIYEGRELNPEEEEKFAEIIKLTIENDENFFNYMKHNTLPDGYQKEVERISRYISTYNEVLYEVEEKVNQIYAKLNNGEIPSLNFGSIMEKADVVNGREQKKIEVFLDKKGIETKAFGREVRK